MLRATENGALVVPVTTALEITNGSMPVLVTVCVVVVVLPTGCRPKATVPRVPIVGGVAAVPFSVTTKLVPVELVIVMVAVLGPDVVPVGLNRTLMLQVTPAASDLPVTHVLV